MKQRSHFCLVWLLGLAAIIVGRASTSWAAVEDDGLAPDATFKPLIEAELPAGFPTYTPVGTIEVKQYPAYRKAETSGRAAFFTLFTHIKTNGIAMTAPVEMTFKPEGVPVGQEQAMAFLYGSPDLGKAGKQGSVKVLDVPAATVVSIGARGQRTDALVAKATERLRAWLSENKQSYMQEGPVRIMGYNSPFVARDRQFFEVQIPVSSVNARDALPAAR
ncbi:MAG: heme-binding protein [Planctomycetia bacterium]